MGGRAGKETVVLLRIHNVPQMTLENVEAEGERGRLFF